MSTTRPPLHAVCADLHLRGDNYSELVPAIGRMLAIAQERGARSVLCAGDVFHRGRIVDRECLYPGTMVRPLRRAIERADLEWLVAPGNHDAANASNVGALATIESDQVRVIERPQVVSWHGLSVAVLPWAERSHFLARPEYRELPAEQQQERFAAAARGVLQWLGGKLRETPGTPTLLGHCETVGAAGDTGGTVLPGSTWYFRPEDLAELGVRAGWLGHYHRRQEVAPAIWFVGALAQGTVGERDNPTGFALWNASTGEVEWLDVPGPRYHRVPAAEYDPTRFGPMDRVELTGTALPDGVELGEHVRFKKETASKEVARGGSELDPGAPLPVLLAEYLARTSAEPIADERREHLAGEIAEVYREELEDLRPADLGGGRSGSGSLERVRRVRVAGIGSHRDTEIAFPDAPGFFGIVGEIGSGKTFLLEALVAVASGEWGDSVRGNLYTLMTAPEARVEVDFEVAGGTVYRAFRHLKLTGRGKSQTCMLTRLLADGTEEPVAGPLAGHFEEEIRRVLGTREELLGSVVLTQFAELDLVRADDKKRRAFLHAFLVGDRFEVLAKATAELRKTANADVRALAPDLDRIPELAGEKVRVEGELAAARGDQADAEKKLTEADAEYEKVVAEGTKLAEQESARKVVVTRRDAKQKELDERKTRAEARRTLAGEIRAELAKSGEISNQVAELDRITAEQERTNESIAAEQSGDAGRVALQEERTRTESAIWKIERNIADTEKDLGRELTTAKQELDRLRADTGDLARAGCRELEDGPLPCPFLSRAHDAADQVPVLEVRLATLGEEQGSGSRTAAARAELATLRARVAEIDEELAKPEHAERAARIADLRKTAADLAVRARELAPARARLARLDARREELGRTEAEIDDLGAEVQRLTVELADVEDELAELPDRAAKLTDLRQNASDWKAKRTAAEATARTAAGAVAAKQARITQIESRLGELDEVKRRHAAAQQKAARLSWLGSAFGADGLPQILVAAAFPVLQSTLDEICDVDFEGAFRLRIDTLTTNAGGDLREGCPILFSRPGTGEYDARYTSGGQVQQVRAALRGALVMYRAEQSSRSYRAAMLDEPTSAQYGPARDATISILRRLRDRFRQVTIVTHDDELIAEIPRLAWLALGPDGWTRIGGAA